MSGLLPDEKAALNIRIQRRYDELMKDGSHGHFECMFIATHEAYEPIVEQSKSWRRLAERLQKAAAYRVADEAKVNASPELIRRIVKEGWDAETLTEYLEVISK